MPQDDLTRRLKALEKQLYESVEKAIKQKESAFSIDTGKALEICDALEAAAESVKNERMYQRFHSEAYSAHREAVKIVHDATADYFLSTGDQKTRLKKFMRAVTGIDNLKRNPAQTRKDWKLVKDIQSLIDEVRNEGVIKQKMDINLEAIRRYTAGTGTAEKTVADRYNRAIGRLKKQGFRLIDDSYKTIGHYYFP